MPDNNSKKRFEEALNLPHNPAIYTMYDGYHIDTCDIYLENQISISGKPQSGNRKHILLSWWKDTVNQMI